MLYTVSWSEGLIIGSYTQMLAMRIYIYPQLLLDTGERYDYVKGTMFHNDRLLLKPGSDCPPFIGTMMKQGDRRLGSIRVAESLLEESIAY